MERSYGKFARRFRLPTDVDRDSVSAVYRNGLLSVAVRRNDERPSGAVRIDVR